MTESAAFNLLELRRYRGIKVEQAGNHLRLQFKPMRQGEHGMMTGFAPPPRSFESDRFEASTSHLSPPERMFLTEDQSYLLAAKVLLELDRWGEKVGAAAANSRLSGDGRHEIVVEATKTAITVVGRHFASLERIAAELATKHASIYATPARDAVEAAIDVHLYRDFKALPVGEQLQLVLSFSTKADTERLLIALARSPERFRYEAEVLKRLDEAWAARIANEKPAEVASLSIAEEANAWARGLTRFVGALLANPSTSGTSGAIDRLMLYQALKAVDAVDLLDFQDHEVVIWERRLNSIAA
jgi:hypothetical protein